MAFALPLLATIGTAAGASAATAGTVGAMIASTAVGAVGSIYAGHQAATAANSQADIAAQNAVAARQQASAREDMQRRQSGLQLGEQRASAAQSGFDSSTVSFGALQGQSAGNAELDALTTRYEGQLQSLSFENQASGLRSQAKSSRNQGYLNAFGTLIGGAAKYGAVATFPSMAGVSGDTARAGNYKVTDF